IPIHDFGEDAALTYYSMPLIDGGSLDRLLAEPASRGALPAKDDPALGPWAARLGLQSAEALEHAHRRGVLHRDIKPANLLLDRQGKLWLTDFGLARIIEEEPVTRTGDLPGTLRYLAPECLEGEADARSDVYSLGLTLYELVTRQPAFAATSRAVLLRQIR